MLTVQRNAGPELVTKIVFYKDGGVGTPLKPGYALCYDVLEDLNEAASEYGELVLGTAVVRPAVGNLEFFAGIVTRVLQRTGTGTDYSSFVEIALPRHGALVSAFTHCNQNAVATTGMTLCCISGEFALGFDTADTVDLYSRRSVAVSAQVKDTSGTAANNWVWMVGKG